MNTNVPRNAPCPCGSGFKYKHCCGKTPRSQRPGRVPNAERRRPSPEEAIRQASSVLKARMPESWGWHDLLKRVTDARSIPLGVVNPEDGRIVRDENRVTDRVELGALRETVITLVSRAYRDLIEPAYGIEIEWFEEPQILRYQPGGFYNPHSDRDHFDADKNQWVQYQDRDFSILLYLDDDYEGGELDFPQIPYRIRPRAGMVLGFPSDYRFVHAARPVTAGIRHAIVSWAAAVGGPRVGRPGSGILHQIDRLSD